MDLEDIELVSDLSESDRSLEDRLDAERLLELIHRLKPLDRQLMLMYLEGMDAESIGDVVGLSPANVRIKIYRIKEILTRRFQRRA